MTDGAMRLGGEFVDGVHRLALRVYYEDTDFSGYVYHANYLRYCERGRSDYLRLLGVHHHELFAEGDAFVVQAMDCRFHAPARIDDKLVVETRLNSAKGARMRMSQVVLCEGQTVFSAEVTAALIARNGRPKRFATWMLERFGVD